jgi:CHAT domain
MKAIRTAETAAILRIEIRRNARGRQLVVVDPVSAEELTLARDLERSQVAEVNMRIWRDLDQIATQARYDPHYPSPSVARATSSQIYRAGFAALLNLLDHSRLASPDDVQGFCRERVTGPWPIVDVLSDPEDHIFFEVLPLFGKVDFTDEDTGVDLADLARVLAGFRVVLRHRPWTGHSVAEAQTDNEVPVPVQFFRHSELVGSLRELESLRRLERKGEVRIVMQYPPKGYRPPPEWPEFVLARALANPWGTNVQSSPTRRAVICHFSCHQETTPEGAFLKLKADGWRAKAARYRVDQIKVALFNVDLIPPEAKVCLVSACKSAAVDPALFLSALEALRILQPRSLVGTLGSLPDLIGAEFTGRLYSALVGGWSLGAALVRVRRELLESPWFNPMGSLYVSHSGEDVYFSTRRDKRDKYVPSGTPGMP